MRAQVDHAERCEERENGDQEDQVQGGLERIVAQVLLVREMLRIKTGVAGELVHRAVELSFVKLAVSLLLVHCSAMRGLELFGHVVRLVFESFVHLLVT